MINRLGIDIGYNATKIFDGQNKILFPSASGTPDTSSFRVFGGTNPIITIPNDGEWMIGHDAVEFSRFLARREDRNWITSKEYYRLFVGALSKIEDLSTNLAIVTGLPVAFYEDKSKLAEVMKGQHTFKVNQTLADTTVTELRVVPQPFGTIFCYALDDNGDIVNPEYANGTIGIIDIGGKTTNLLVASKMAERTRQTSSVNSGGWDVIRSVEKIIKDKYEDIDIRDHELSTAVIEKRIKYYGEYIDISHVVDSVLESFMAQVIDESTKLWGSAASVDKIIVTGGGAMMIGEFVKTKYRHAVVANDPVFSNAIGYWKFSRRIK